MVPGRLTFYLGLQRYRERILSLGCRSAFTQGPEGLFAVSRWELESICYMFPGVENPLRISRYPLAKRLGPVFNALLFSSLKKVEVILACADEAAISRLVAEGAGRLLRERIVQLPTCVDLDEFRPTPLREARTALGIPSQVRLFVTSGRISQFKGWPLLLDAFCAFKRNHEHSLLVFVGDGEDRPRLDAAIAARDLCRDVRITGFLNTEKVVTWLNAADAVVIGSLAEGWSVSMLEALACGKAIVSTPVSGASDMILPGGNGLIVQSRDPEEFAAAMERVLSLKDVAATSAAIVTRFSLSTLGDRLRQLWYPLHEARTRAQIGRARLDLVRQQ
jgi:glycosyltransferase involved in cell wall biosynthesis